jgi:hypothetical protein
MSLLENETFFAVLAVVVLVMDGIAFVVTYL